MKSPRNSPASGQKGRRQPALHVTLTPVPTATPPFHALHGTVPVTPAAHLPNEIEDGIEHPPHRP